MYISEATRDALCNAGIWGICLTLGGMCLAVAMPRIMRNLKIIKIKLKIAYLKILLAWCDVQLAALDLLERMIKAAHRARAKRRYRSAMKVFEKPVRWEEK